MNKCMNAGANSVDDQMRTFAIKTKRSRYELKGASYGKNYIETNVFVKKNNDASERTIDRGCFHAA